MATISLTTTAGVLPAFSLIGDESAHKQIYGEKTALFAHRLLNLQREIRAKPERDGCVCPSFRVPHAFGVPVDAKPDDATLKRVYDSLTVSSGAVSQGPRGVLMARSSAVPGQERPGANPTLLSAFDQVHPDKGFDRFRTNVHTMLETEGMGVLATFMVGTERQLRFGDHAGKFVFGADNLAFCADTHGVRMQETQMAIVNGLGDRVVGLSDAILLFAHRKNSSFRSVINLRDRRLLELTGSKNAPMEYDDYRQQKATVFALDKDALIETDLPDLEPNDDLNFFASKLREGSFALSNGGKLLVLGEKGWHSSLPRIGHLPFLGSHQPAALSGLLQFIGKTGGVQIEGAFLPSAGAAPFLYQWLPIPEDLFSIDGEFDVDSIVAHATSNDVVGALAYQGPLMMVGDYGDRNGGLPNRHTNLMKSVDRALRNHGEYVMLGLDGFSLQEVLSTPHARVRLATGHVNPLSHVVTDARLSWLYKDRPQVLFGSGLQFSNAPEATRILAKLNSGGVFMCGQAKVVADGKRLAVQFIEE